MLVLTRKQQEKIQIGDNITITILRTKGKAVRIGIEAPDSVSVLRGELAARREQEAAEAKPAKPSPAPTTESRSQPAAAWTAERPDTDAKVSMQRVTRSRVATVLPQMLGAKSMSEGGPLRSMLDRRNPGQAVGLQS